MNMASIDTAVLQQMIQADVQITHYKSAPKAEWTGIIGFRNIPKQKVDFWPVSLAIAEAPVSYHPGDQCYKMKLLGREVYMLRFSDGWEWSHEKGLYGPMEEATKQGKVLPKGEKYYKVFHCHGCQTCWEMDETGENIIQHPHILSQEDVTDAIKELVKTSKEPAAIAVASKVVIDSFGEKK